MSNEVLVFVDTETTGLNPKDHDMIEFAAVAYQNGRLVGEIEQRVKPLKENFTLGALAVNKLYPSTMDEDFGEPELVAHNIANFFVNLPNPYRGSIYFAGHNAKFDKDFSTEFMRRMGYTDFGDFSGRLVDTCGLARFLIDSGLLACDKTGLAPVAKALGVEYDASKHHGAMYDAQLATEVYFAMIDLVQANNGLKKSFMR
jgi:DNA polymerase III epsilon subunit-like protein